MARKRISANLSDSQAPVPVYGVNIGQAEAAFAAYNAVCLAARDTPSLTGNPYYEALRDTAFARFMAVFEALK